MRERVERMAADLDLVTREEFDAVRTMAANARPASQDELAAKVATLEAELASLRPRVMAKRHQAAPRPQDGWIRQAREHLKVLLVKPGGIF